MLFEASPKLKCIMSVQV